VAVAAELRLRERTARGLCFLLLLLCLPWLVGVRQRPLIPLQAEGVVGSILVEPRTSLLFANNRGLERPYTAMTRLIEAAGCQNVGVALGGNSAEYPLWALLGEPGRGAHRIEWIVDGTPSAQLRDPAFEPCALVCESCPAGWEDYHGMPEAYRRGSFRLFLAGDESSGAGTS
jgi:hypothetical protein